MTRNKPKPTWKAWTEHDGDKEILYVKLDRWPRHTITLNEILIGDLGAAIMLLIVRVRDQAVKDGWLEPLIDKSEAAIIEKATR